MADPANESETADCLVTFQPLGRRVTVSAGTTLLEAGRRAGLLLSAACGGVGICGRCRVSVTHGEMHPPANEEQEFLAKSFYSPGTRLACEARVASSVTVDITPGTFTTGQRIQTDSNVELQASDCIPDRQFTAFAEAGQRPLGLAVDVGCTKIAAFLVDLSTGAQLAAAGTANPQITYGEDLISRLVFADASTAQATTLAHLVRECIASLATDLCSDAKVTPQQIADACIVGNTAMMHLFLSLPVSQLLRAPFISSVDCDVDIPAVDLGWQFAPAASVHVLPGIGGFVGADHVAMILAREIDRTDLVTIGLDIGTNTEIVLRDPHSGKFLTTSVPSGPVFEGAHIADGMRAASGAIDSIYSFDGEVRWTTIDSAKPIGLCGSGTVDLIAELLHLGLINDRGHLAKKGSGIRTGSCGTEFLAVPGSETAHGRDIVLTQHDVTQVQLAKAAIFAGIATLLQIAGVSQEAVQQVVVAGAFGSYLNLRSAIAIGMLPRFANAEYLQVGNAAGAGAKLALVSQAERGRARTIARTAMRIELKKHRSFDTAMARATRFPKASFASPTAIAGKSGGKTSELCSDDRHH